MDCSCVGHPPPESRTETQAAVVRALNALSDEFRGIVDAAAIGDWTTECCTNDIRHGFGIVCGPRGFGYLLCLECAAAAVELWLSDPHRTDAREILSLDVRR